ncbi:MAG: hypothetical protein PHS88_00250 [Candidatus Omnitrophica bacterium]|nr:hypothetical protein [Candidatus Omnitrophota bacterium]
MSSFQSVIDKARQKLLAQKDQTEGRNPPAPPSAEPQIFAGWNHMLGELGLLLESFESVIQEIDSEKSFIQKIRNLDGKSVPASRFKMESLRKSLKDAIFTAEALAALETRQILTSHSRLESAEEAVRDLEKKLGENSFGSTREVAQLREELKKSREQTDDLRRRLAASETDQRQAKDQMTALELRKNRFEAELQEIRGQSGDFEEKSAELLKQIETLESEKHELESKHTRLELEKAELKRSLLQKQTEYARFVEDSVRLRHELEAELGKVRNESISLKNEAKGLRALLDIVEADKRGLAEQKSAAEKQKAEIEKAFADKEQEYRSRMDESARLSGEFERKLLAKEKEYGELVEESSRTQGALEAELIPLRQDIEKWKARAGELWMQVETLEKGRQETDSTRAALEKEKADIQSELFRLRDEARTWQSKHDEMANRIGLLEVVRRDLEAGQAAVAEEKGRLEAMLKGKEAECQGLTEENARMRGEIESGLHESLDRVRQWKSRSEELSKELESLEAQKRELEEQRIKFEYEKDELLQRFKIKDAEYREVVERSAQMQGRLEEDLLRSREQTGVWQSKAEELLRQIESLEKTKLEIEAKLADALRDNEALAQQLQAKNAEHQNLVEESARIRTELERALGDSREECGSWKSKVEELVRQLEAEDVLKREIEADRSARAREKESFEEMLAAKDEEYRRTVEESARLRAEFEAELQKTREESGNWKMKAEEYVQRLERIEIQEREIEKQRAFIESEKAGIDEKLLAKDSQYLRLLEDGAQGRSALEDELRQSREETTEWKGKINGLVKQLQAVESAKRELEEKKSLMERTAAAAEAKLAVREEEFRRAGEESAKLRGALENELWQVRRDSKKWESAAEKVMVERRLFELEKQKLQRILIKGHQTIEEWQNRYKEAVIELEALRKNTAPGREREQNLFDAQNREINKWKEACQVLEKKMAVARDLFVQRLGDCAEEIDSWKRKAQAAADALQKALEKEKPQAGQAANEFRPRPARENVYVLTESAAVKEAKRKLAEKTEKEDIHKMQPVAPNADSDKGSRSSIFELRRFQDIIEGE